MLRKPKKVRIGMKLKFILCNIFCVYFSSLRKSFYAPTDLKLRGLKTLRKLSSVSFLAGAKNLVNPTFNIQQ